jgi:hypothetical protein
MAEIMPIIEKSEQERMLGGGDGSSGNPYTWDEYEYLADNNNWSGGYVEGAGYTGAQANIYAYDQNDCWWRCMAYVKSCGGNYSASAAVALAMEYYGNGFNANNYAFSGNYYDATSYVSGYVTNGSYCSSQVLVFDPTTVSGWEGVAGTRHAVVVIDYTGDVVNVFDPRSDEYGSINLFELNNSQSGYYVNIQ